MPSQSWAIDRACSTVISPYRPMAGLSTHLVFAVSTQLSIGRWRSQQLRTALGWCIFATDCRRGMDGHNLVAVYVSRRDAEPVRDRLIEIPSKVRHSAGFRYYPGYYSRPLCPCCGGRMERASLFKAGRPHLEFELARIVANDADIGFGKTGGSFGFDFEGNLHLGARVALKLHDDRVQDRVE
jgi:hypothetical protein